MKTVSIIGIGRIGGGLAIALNGRKYKIENLVSRENGKIKRFVEKFDRKPNILGVDEFDKIKSDIIFITTPDGQIAATAENLSKKLTRPAVVFHTSGALSSEVLRDLQNIKCLTGSIHPLVSVSDMFSAKKRFENAFFAVEGDAEAVRLGEKIAADLGGKAFQIDTKYKTLYHAAAVTACGHLVAVIDVALEMLAKCGLNEETGRQILMPLIKSTIENLETQTTSGALTGTFARADVETFKNHVRSIEANLPREVLDIYLRLGSRSLSLAEKQGANPESLEKLRSEISLAKNAADVKIELTENEQTKR